jgi:hypothetical protein
MIDRKPHVHAALIKQWADGAQIEVLGWESQIWLPVVAPLWCPNAQYRVKPVPHPQQDLIDAARNGDATIQFQGALGTGEWYSFLPALVDEFREGVPHDVKLRRAHKWQKEMDAYAAGKAVQFRGIEGTGDWLTADGGLSHEDMYWDHPTYEYRIKPEQVVKQCRATLNEKSLGVYTISRESMNLKLTFEDDKLIKAEVL